MKQIAAELEVSQASVSVWVRDIQLTDEQLRALQARVARTPHTPAPANLVPDVVAYRHPQFTPSDAQPGYRHHHTKSKGDVAEAVVLALFAVHGFMVSQPFSENSPYDLVVDDGSGRLAKIQVKHGHVKEAEGLVFFATCSANGRGRRLYSSDDCDFFAVWCPELGTMYVIPQATLEGQTSASLRLHPTWNQQRVAVRWARGHEFAGELPWPDAAEPTTGTPPLQATATI